MKSVKSIDVKFILVMLFLGVIVGALTGCAVSFDTQTDVGLFTAPDDFQPYQWPSKNAK